MTLQLLTILVVCSLSPGAWSQLSSSGSGSTSGSGEVGSGLGSIPFITLQPLSQNVLVGESLQLTCIANGSSPLFIQWLKDNTEVSSGIEEEVSDIESVQSVLNLNGSLEDSGSYVCNVSNEIGFAVSSVAIVTVLYPASVTVFPRDPIVNETDTAVLTCQGFGVPTPQLTWYSNRSLVELGSGSGTEGSALVSTGFGSQLPNISGEIEISTSMGVNEEGQTVSVSVLRLFFVMKSDENISYTCQGENGVTNTIGVISDITVTLSIQVPPTVSVIGSDTLLGIVGASITLSFRITGDSPRVTTGDIRWFFNNGVTNTDITGAGTNGYSFSMDLLTLTITGLANTHEGNYTMVASNAAGTGESTINLQIEAGPVIITTPANQEIIFGEDVTFNCTSVAEPLHSIIWLFNSSLEIASYNATTNTPSLLSSDKYFLEPPSSPVYGSLTVRSVTLSDAGVYMCTVSNVHESQAASALLQVQLPPNTTISSTFLSGIFGGSVSFSCLIEAFPRPTITWLVNGTELDTSAQDVSVQTTSTTDLLTMSTLSFTSLTLDDNGNYTCQAMNALAERRQEESDPLSLSILYPPNVTTLEPREIIINQTQEATFTCQAYGIPTPSISWLNVSSGQILVSVSGVIEISETIIPPTTRQSVLRFVNGLKTDESVYTCTGTNNIVNIIESPEQDNITLLVQVPVEIVNDPIDTIHYAGGNISISCNASGIPLPTFQWYKNNILITPNDRVYHFTTVHYETAIDSLVESTLVLRELVLSDDDDYHCQATNPGAHSTVFNVFSNTAHLTVQHPPNTTVTPEQIIVNSTVTSITFTCYSFGIPSPSLSWQQEKSGAILQSLGPVQIVNTMTLSSATSVLTLFDPTDVEESNYTCTAVNNITNVLDTPEFDVGELYVQDPTRIVTPPSARTHPAGFAFVDLICTATGLPVPTISWYKNGILLTEDGSHIEIRENPFELSDFGINYGRLHIVNLVLSDDADYVCVSNNTGAPGITFNVSSSPVHITVQYPPLVSVSPSSLILNQTDTAVFTCTIFGIPTPSFNWINGSTVLSTLSDLLTISNTTEDYNITTTLTINVVQRTDMGTYTCMASNGIDNLIESPESDSVQLFVQEPSQFISGPVNVTNYTAGVAIFSCQASGIPLPNIVWFKDNVQLNDGGRVSIDTFSSIEQNERNITSVLTIVSLQLSDTGYYHCTASNPTASAGSVFGAETEPAYLFVQYPPLVTITPQLTVINQTNSTFYTCSLFGVPTPQVMWSRTRNGITDTLSPPGTDPSISTAVDGYNVTSVLLFNSSVNTDEGQYTCKGENEVFNAIDTPESASVNLFIQIPSLFIDHPQSVTNYTAGQAIFSCTVYGLPVPSIVWLKDDQVIEETANLTIATVESFTDTSGEAVSVLTIVNLVLDDAGVYRCTANNTGDLGNEFTVYSLTARLIVEYPPSLSIDPVIMTVNQTDRVPITCTVFAVPLPVITWTDDRDNSILTPLDDVITIQQSDSENTRTSVLTFLSIVKANESNYTCTAVNNITNVIGTVESATSSLTVQVPATVTSLVGLFLHRQNGDNATLTFALSEDSPPVKTENIRWFLRTVSGISDITFSTDPRHTLSQDRLSLLIDGITETDEGEYILRATNEAGTGEQAIAISVIGPPAIINGPVPQRRIEGDSVTFNCFATGDPVPAVTWRFNDSLILTNNTKYSVGDISDGINFGALTINDLTYFDKGTYECTATNVNGTSSLNVELEIQVVPVVTIDPITQDSIAGGVVTLNCTVYGFPAVDIEWLKDGVVVTSDTIPDSTIEEIRGSLPVDITVTSSLTITNLQLHDVANYTCNVSNEFVEPRFAMSEPAELTVLYPPNVDVSPKSFIVNQTQFINFTCTSYGIPVPSLTWYDIRNMSQPLLQTDELNLIENIYENRTGFSLAESVLVFPEALRTDMSTYICIASNGIPNLLNTPETGQAILYVQLPAKIESSPVENVRHFRGGTTNISCSAEGLPLPTITWFKNDALLNLTERVFVVEQNESNATSGFVMSTLVFDRLKLSDNASYYCEANNTGGPGITFLVTSESSFVFITHPPNVTLTPTDQLTVNVTFTATLTCTVFAIPLPAISWLKAVDGSIVTPDDRITITEIDATHIRTSILNFTSTIKSDESLYTCIAVNNITNVLNTPENETIMLRIQVPANVTAVTSSPAIGVEGESITLTFSITEDDPLVNVSNIRWQFTGASGTIDITDSTNIRYTFADDRLSLRITHLVLLADSGFYTISATNEAGTITESIQLIVETPPQIYAIPNDLAILENETAVFRCLAIATPTPDHAWYYDGQLIEPDEKYTIGDRGAEFGSLFINEVEFQDRGTYTCVYNNTVSTLSISVELSVQVSPVITGVSVPANGTAGDTAVMRCDTVGFPAPDISWLMNGSIIFSSPGKRDITLSRVQDDITGVWNVSSTLQVYGLMLQETGVYSCSATNNLASEETVDSQELELIVLYPPAVSVSPSNLTINQTYGAVFTCTVFSIPSSSIQWYLNNETVTEDDDSITVETVRVLNGSSLYIQISTLTVSNAVRSLHEGNYTCTAINGVDNLIGTPETDSISLIIQVPPTVRSISTSPLGVVNNSVTLSFDILNAFPSVTLSNIQWIFNETILLNDGSVSTRLQFSSNLLSLTLFNLQHSDQGPYTLIASNEAGINSSTVFLEIQAAPVILSAPSNISQLEGEKVTFQCRAIAEPTHTVQWFYENDQLSLRNTKYRVAATIGDVAYGDLTVFDVRLNDTGLYTCQVTNTHGTANASAYLNVQVIPQFREDPEDMVQLIGENMTMSCTAFAVPAPSITWLKNGAPLNLMSPNVAIANSTGGYNSSSQLTIVSLTFPDAANYSCVATNELVSVQTTNSSVATLTVHMPVVITDSPVNTKVNETESVQFQCTAEGLPDPVFVWSTPDDTDLSDRTDLGINSSTQMTSGASIVNSVLTFSSIRDTDDTQYTCTASNRPAVVAGDQYNVSSSFNVTVQTRPVVQFIDRGPIIAVEFRDVELTVNITRDFPLVVSEDIQWFFQRQANESRRIVPPVTGGAGHYILSQDRLSLRIVNLSLSDDSGLFIVEASNIVGTSSATVTLDVQRAPVIITPLIPLRQLSGTNAIFTCTAVAVPQHTTQWLKDNTDGAPLSNSTKYLITGLGTATSVLTVIDIQLSDSGTYTCFAENEHGNDSTSDQLFVQVPPRFSVFPESLSLIAGDVNIVVTCNVTGYPQPSVDILKDGVVLESERRSDGSLSDGTLYSSASVLLPSLTYNESGSYSCNASNFLASVQNRNSLPAQFVVEYPPDVSVTPVSIVVNETDPVSFICTVFGIPPPNIVWINETQHELTDSQEEFISITFSSIPHLSGTPVNISNLTILRSAKRHESNYTCIASNGVTNLIGTPENGTVSLTVQVPPSVSPVLSAVLGVVNNSISLTFIIERASPLVLSEDINWSFTDSSSGITSSIEFIANRTVFSSDRRTLTLFNLQEEDEGQYSLTAFNAAGVDSAVINLTIQAPPVFVETPRDASRLQGETAVFNCSAISEPVHSVRWDREGVTIAQYISTEARVSTIASFARLSNTERGVSVTSNDSRYRIEGESSSLYGQLTIFGVTLDDARNYTCHVANVHGNLSANASLTVQVTPTFPGQSDRNITVAAGENITLYCYTQGQPLPNVTWYKDGEIIQETDTVRIEETSDSLTSFNSTLMLLNVQRIDEGRYHCVAVNFLFVVFAEDSPYTDITVEYPANITSAPPTSIERTAAQYAVFTCIVSGLPPPTIQWNTSSNGLISNRLGKYSISNGTVSTSRTGPSIVYSTLVVLNLTLDDQEMYTCSGVHLTPINNFIGAVDTASSQLFVRASPRVFSIIGPTVILWNTSHTISFTITRSQPAITPGDIVWMFTSVTGQKSILFGNETSSRYSFSANRYNLTISPVRVQDIGSYQLTASNEGGNSSASVVIQQVLASPVIDEESGQINASLGTSVSFNCTADGIPLPSLTWRLNGTLLTGGGTRWSIREQVLVGRRVRSQLDSGQSVFSQLTLSEVDRFDQGSLISCQADNDIRDSVIVNYSLIVEGIPPDPCNSDPCMNGGTCYLNGNSFKCVCSAPYTGSVCQDSVTVPIGPDIISFPQPVSSPLFTPVNLTCIVQGNPFPHINWYKDGVQINGQHSSVYYISQLTVEERGMYWCTAINQLTSRTVSSVPALVTITNIAQYLMTVTVTQNQQQLVYRLNQEIVGTTYYNNSATVFSVQLYSSNNDSTVMLLVTAVVTESNSMKQAALTELFNNTGADFDPSFVVRDSIRFDGCISEVTESSFTWSETNLGTTLSLDCPCGGLSLGTGRPLATRTCAGNFSNGANWTSPNTTQCDFDTQLQLLCNVTQLSSTNDQLNEIESLTANNLDSVQLLVTVSLLERLISDTLQSTSSISIFLDILDRIATQNSNVLNRSQEISNVSSRALELIDNFLAMLPLPADSSSLVISRSSFILAIQEVQLSKTVTFSLSNDRTVTLSNTAQSDQVSVVLNQAPIDNSSDTVRLTHAIFNSMALFPSPGTNGRIGSPIVSTSLVNGTLLSPVNISFNSSQVETGYIQECSFLDFSLNDGRGDWSSEGCTLVALENRSICVCDHLTHFALILTPEATTPTAEMTDTPSYLIAMEALSVFAVVFSLVFFILTLAVHLGTWKLRIKPPVQLLVNTCVGLLLLYILYIGALYARSHETACIVLSTFLHYALLVVLIALLGQYVYLLLQGVCLPLKHYPLFLIIFSWVLPLFLVTFCVAPGHHLYASDRICIPRSVPFYVGVLVPFLLCCITSVVILLITCIILARISFQSVLTSNFLAPLATAVLFILGWSAVLAKANAPSGTATALEVIFFLTGGLLGFYFFIMYCIASADVRSIWGKKCRCMAGLSHGISATLHMHHSVKSTDMELSQHAKKEKVTSDTIDTHLSPEHDKNTPTKTDQNLDDTSIDV